MMLVCIELLAEITQGVNLWYIASFELVLIIGFVTYSMLRDLKKAFDIDILEIFNFLRIIKF